MARALFSDDEGTKTVETWDTPHPDIKGRVGKRKRTIEQNLRVTVYFITGLVALAALGATFVIATGGAGIHTKYATDAFLVALVFGFGPFGYFYNRDLNRIKAIDDKFPDFLRDLSESSRAGMTLPRALVNAAHGAYGGLTPEIKKMASQVEWGVNFAEVIERFADRVRSPLIDRTVSLIVEAQRAGGSMVEILGAAADDAREIKQIVTSRSNQMAAYMMVIYISFFVFIAVVLVLQAQFIPAFKIAVDAAGSGSRVGGLQFKQFDPEDFNTIFFHASLVQGIGGALVGGVLTKGNAITGLKSGVIMIISAWLSFRVLVSFL